MRDLLSSVDNLSRAVTAVPIEKEKLDEPIKNLRYLLDLIKCKITFLYFILINRKISK